MFRTSGHDDIKVADLGGVSAQSEPTTPMHGVTHCLMRTHYAPFSDLLYGSGPARLLRPMSSADHSSTRLMPLLKLAESRSSAMVVHYGRPGDVSDRIRFPDGRPSPTSVEPTAPYSPKFCHDYPGHGIVFDMPRVGHRCPRDAGRRQAHDRATVEGELFDAVPAANIYVMSAVLHDCDDASALRILLISLTPPTRTPIWCCVEIVVTRRMVRCMPPTSTSP